MAHFAAAREAFWMNKFGKLLRLCKSELMAILGDDTAESIMANTHKLTDSSKHIEIQYNYVRQMVNNATIYIQHVISENNTVDIPKRCLQCFSMKKMC